jgi:hypothetical protein
MLATHPDHMPTVAAHTKSLALSLERTPLGWALRDNRHRAVFQARGRDARRKCLAYAAELGTLHVRVP